MQPSLPRAKTTTSQSRSTPDRNPKTHRAIAQTGRRYRLQVLNRYRCTRAGTARVAVHRLRPRRRVWCHRRPRDQYRVGRDVVELERLISQAARSPVASVVSCRVCLRGWVGAEGHTLHGLTRDLAKLVGPEVSAASPQGRFPAEKVDGQPLTGVDAYASTCCSTPSAATAFTCTWVCAGSGCASPR
jgi:hypothetical protein